MADFSNPMDITDYSIPDLNLDEFLDEIVAEVQAERVQEEKEEISTLQKFLEWYLTADVIVLRNLALQYKSYLNDSESIPPYLDAFKGAPEGTPKISSSTFYHHMTVDRPNLVNSITDLNVLMAETGHLNFIAHDDGYVCVKANYSGCPVSRGDTSLASKVNILFANQMKPRVLHKSLIPYIPNTKGIDNFTLYQRFLKKSVTHLEEGKKVNKYSSSLMSCSFVPDNTLQVVFKNCFNGIDYDSVLKNFNEKMFNVTDFTIDSRPWSSFFTMASVYKQGYVDLDRVLAGLGFDAYIGEINPTQWLTHPKTLKLRTIVHTSVSHTHMDYNDDTTWPSGNAIYCKVPKGRMEIVMQVQPNASICYPLTALAGETNPVGMWARHNLTCSVTLVLSKVPHLIFSEGEIPTADVLTAIGVGGSKIASLMLERIKAVGNGDGNAYFMFDFTPAFQWKGRFFDYPIFNMHAGAATVSETRRRVVTKFANNIDFNGVSRTAEVANPKRRQAPDFVKYKSVFFRIGHYYNADGVTTGAVTYEDREDFKPIGNRIRVTDAQGNAVEPGGKRKKLN